MSELPKPPPTSPHLPAISLWLALQLLTLCLPTLHVPLSDDFPRPIERLAIHEMIAVQIAAGAMLFPMLFTNVLTTIGLIASTWPFLQLAAMLSATPTPRLLSASLYLTVWMISLALCGSALTSHRARLRAAALATSFTLAGPLLWYLHHEFNDNVMTRATLAAANPVLSAFALLNDAERSTGGWILISTMLAMSLATSLLLRRHRAHHNNLSTSHPQSPAHPRRAQP